VGGGGGLKTQKDRYRKGGENRKDIRCYSKREKWATKQKRNDKGMSRTNKKWSKKGTEMEYEANAENMGGGGGKEKDN
jgi:hypothetical protein